MIKFLNKKYCLKYHYHRSPSQSRRISCYRISWAHFFSNATIYFPNVIFFRQFKWLVMLSVVWNHYFYGKSSVRWTIISPSQWMPGTFCVPFSVIILFLFFNSFYNFVTLPTVGFFFHFHPRIFSSMVNHEHLPFFSSSF